MPIYEYACLQCGAEFEKLVQASAAVACPSCQSPRVSRRLSLVGVRTEARGGSALSGPVAGAGGGCCGGGCRCH